jgi:hypothetical protein
MVNDEARRHYRKRLTSLAKATRYLNRPEELATDINDWICRNQPDVPRNIVMDRFETEGGSSGAGRWKPLALLTAVKRRKLGYGDFNPILRRSGLLMRAATWGALEANPRAIVMTFKDGPAPVYRGGGKHTKRRRKFFVVENGVEHRIKKKEFDLFRGERASESTSTHSVGSLSDYAEGLNEERPFYGAPTELELQPLKELGSALLQRALAAIHCGDDPGL